jgi:DEAD/DEAH box helicase domain-containing protein
MDIGSLSTQSHPDTGKPQVMLYDACAGGIGISEQGFRLVEKVWQAALDTITLCACKTGCPACIQSPRCGTNNQSLDKQGAALLLRAMLG